MQIYKKKRSIFNSILKNHPKLSQTNLYNMLPYAFSVLYKDECSV